MKDWMHEKILENMDQLCSWFEKSSKDIYLPFYSSYDIRDSSFKITNVDANIFPAGFNNICTMDKEQSPELINNYIRSHYPETKKILLLTEDHLKNSYYWENVFTIQQLIAEAGYEVKVGMPGLSDQEEIELESYVGNKVLAHKVYNENGQLQTKNFAPDLIVSNNDFSKTYDHWGDIKATRMTPIMEMGWYQRKKSTYFAKFNETATEFAQLLDVDPWLFTVETSLYDKFDMGEEESQKQLASLVDEIMEATREKYKEHDINEEPFVFIKNDSGTYGLGVTKVTRGQDVLEWTYKARKKMKAQKGGGQFSKVIVQEGVPTKIQTEGWTAEPTIYMLGSGLAGGFLRAHKDKNESESLNSPGAVYKRLCLSDLKIKAEGCPLENVYGWIAKIGLVAIGRETAQMNLKYQGYQ